MTMKLQLLLVNILESTNIIVKSVDGNLKDTCKVTIEPYFYLYRNPLFDFIADNRRGKKL